MGRKKKYDEVEALEKAMYLFWRTGYDGVKTRDLADAMGINQYSLYASFKSKDALFVSVLEQYLQVIVCDWLIKPLVEQADGLKAIRQFFEVFVEPNDGTIPTGCLICNTIVETEQPNADVQLVIDRYQSMLTVAFAGALHRSNPEASTQEIKSRANLLLCLILGIAVKKRNGFQGRPVQQVVEQIVAFVTPTLPEI
jgi:TetR/AcrR family transcriptional repressor of nem operon